MNPDVGGIPVLGTFVDLQILWKTWSVVTRGEGAY